MRNIIITGTSNGIGYETVRVLLNQGHQVLSLSRNPCDLEESNSQQLAHINFDVTDNKNSETIIDFIKNQWNSKVDIVINNAGKLVNAPFSKTSLDQFKSVYAVNVFGVVNLLQLVLPFMNSNGHVLNISSMGGIQGSMKFAGLSAYSSSKGALITLTELLAEEYKETGPSFNVLALGAVQTKMLEEAFPDFKAPVSAKEMASYIANFALSSQQFYNGKVLQVSSTTP